MKTLHFKKSQIVVTLLSIAFSFTMSAQVGGWNPNLINDSKEALHTMIEKVPKLESFYNESYGYAVFPKITKAGFGIGGPFGKGIVFKDHQVVGSSKLKQASYGFQFGEQQYREVIFFKNEKSFENFTNEKLKFDA